MTPSENAATNPQVKKEKIETYVEQLLALGQTLNSSLKLDEVLNMAIESVVEFVRAERGFIMLFNEAGDLELKACQNVDRESIRKLEGISKTILKASAWEGRSILSVDAQKDPRFREKDSVMLTGMRSVMSVPLKVKQHITGIIYLDNRIEQGMFNDNHLSMLVAFANQAAVAIENAKLHENLIRSYDDRIRLTRELHQKEKMRLASEEANRLKSEFVGIVSHELRSPLTVLKTYTSALSRDVETNRNSITEEMKKDIYQTIDCECDRLLSMIEKLLDVSSIDAGRPMRLDMRKANIGQIIDNVVKLQRTSKFFKKDKHTLDKDIQDDIPEIICDKDKIQQVILNLVDNALKYSPHGGEVKIKISREDDMVRFAISDQGLGIPEKDKEKLFQKFERFDNAGCTIPGTGLGLFLVKNLIDMHGGRIWVESEENKGSSFIFELPVEQKNKEQAKK